MSPIRELIFNLEKMQYPQTRYEDSLAAGISAVALSMTVNTTAPTRTEGILTIGRLSSGGGPNIEDVYYSAVAGTDVTIDLRGLSQTALTLTSLLGNQKPHNADESVEMNTHHNFITDLLRKTENDTVTGEITFTEPIATPAILDENGNEVIEFPAAASAVNYAILKNSAAGDPVEISVDGTDTDINLEILAKGAGILTIPNQSETKTNAAPIANKAIANKKYVDDAISTAIITTNSRRILQGKLGVIVAAGDLSGHTNLLYFSKANGDWRKVTNVNSTNTLQLGLALEEGGVGDTIDILIQGEYTRTFANINPSFSGTGAGNINIGNNATNHAVGIRINNSQGAEAQINQLVLSLRQVGAPSGDLRISIVLEQTVSSVSQPACFYDTGSGLIRGAVISTASISQSLFSGTYQDFTVSSFSNSPVRIPSGSLVYVVLSTTTINGSNYYQIQGSAARLLNTATWTGTGVSNVVWSLSTTSLSPVGFSAKCGDALTNASGSWSLAGWDSTNWARVIGQVINATTVYFNPVANTPRTVFFDSGQLVQVSASNFGLNSDTSNTYPVPNQGAISIFSILDATADSVQYNQGVVDAELGGQSFCVQGLNPGNFTGTSPTSGAAGFILINGTVSGVGTQNNLYIVRTERGFYSYIGYPASANFLSVGAAGFAGFYFRYMLTFT